MSDQPQLKSTQPPKTSFYKHAARFSLLPPLIIFITSHTVFNFIVDPTSKRIISVICLSLLVPGFILAILALSGVSKYGRKGIIGLAITGLFLNGSIIVLTLILLPALQRVKQSRVVSTAQLESIPDAIPNSVRIIDPNFGFRFELPQGFEEYKQGYAQPGVIYSYVKTSPDKTKLLVNIERLGGILGRQEPSDDELKRVFSLLPPGSKVKKTHEQWKGYALQGFSVQMTVSGQTTVVFNVQVPLSPEAIQLNVAGPVGTEDECRSILSQILRSVKGKSNWD